MGKEYTDPIPFQTSIMNTLDGNAKYWVGKDYVNFIIKDLVNLEAPYVDIVDRAQTPRMPWHDIGAVVGEWNEKTFFNQFKSLRLYSSQLVHLLAIYPDTSYKGGTPLS